ncbi:MAG: hypothetical protein K2P94_15355 [Rhodospirillaceae bacterium]|nr:hypothetical protein [Rhodospirillaceae bacterium]
MEFRKIFAAGLVLSASAPAWPADARAQEKVEINVMNNRQEPVVMRFEYAFRQYTWKLMEHTIDGGDDITYRFPANIPGCERLREWRITDGLLTISNARGPVCQKRISLCDKYAMTMAVGDAACKWSVD